MKYKDTLKRAFAKREHLFSDIKTNCYRIFNSEADGIGGLTIDLYGEFILIQYFSEPLSGELKSNSVLKKAIEEAVMSLNVDVRGILVKNRVKIKGNRDYYEVRKSILIHGDSPPHDYNVKQNGIFASVDLIKGQNTGIFLDMREIREYLALFYKENSSCKTMLNLFCYTALFSAHALKNGITYATNVDLSRSVLQRAKTNYSLNGLECDNRDFIFGDALDWIKRFIKNGKNFSFIVFDPPTFSRNKKGSFSVKKDYGDTLSLLGSLAPGGFVFTSTNLISISKDDYFSYHPTRWKCIKYQNESSDFPSNGSPYLKAGLWECE